MPASACPPPARGQYTAANWCGLRGAGLELPAPITRIRSAPRWMAGLIGASDASSRRRIRAGRRASATPPERRRGSRRGEQVLDGQRRGRRGAACAPRRHRPGTLEAGDVWPDVARRGDRQRAQDAALEMAMPRLERARSSAASGALSNSERGRLRTTHPMVRPPSQCAAPPSAPRVGAVDVAGVQRGPGDHRANRLPRSSQPAASAAALSAGRRRRPPCSCAARASPLRRGSAHGVEYADLAARAAAHQIRPMSPRPVTGMPPVDRF